MPIIDFGSKRREKQLTIPVSNVIIGGVAKAATSSLYAYLSDHPEVGHSVKKETNFFLKDVKGEPGADLRAYGAFFPEPASGEKVMIEATPAYLSGGADVANKIRNTLSEVKLIFILRNPVDRFYSFYNFNRAGHTSGFEVLNRFEDYLERAFAYASCGEIPSGSRMKEKNLRSLLTGRYAIYLKEFYRFFSPEEIKVVFQEDLRDDPVVFMSALCEFLDIDPYFFGSYSFAKQNVTTSVRSRRLHRAVTKFSRKLESLYKRRPGIKGGVDSVYRLLNVSEGGYPEMSPETRARLTEYYEPYNRELKELLGAVKCPKWVG